MLPGSTGVSQGFAVAVAVLSVGGSVHTQSVLPAVYGLLYAACFALAMRGLSSPLQLVLMFAMVGLSFALHMVFLPAGLCCFFSLMIAKNDVLMGVTGRGGEKGTKAA
mmetsp:Transcript_27996/g.66634  ORF Transcript_27996/g.66634 Transcript_27996/m.66634 type:complete len:108 (-) Transcript_27996:97-420(-)